MDDGLVFRTREDAIDFLGFFFEMRIVKGLPFLTPGFQMPIGAPFPETGWFEA